MRDPSCSRVSVGVVGACPLGSFRRVTLALVAAVPYLRGETLDTLRSLLSPAARSSRLLVYILVVSPASILPE